MSMIHVNMFWINPNNSGQTNQILFAFTFMTHILCNFGGKLGLYEQLFDILWLQKIGSRRLKVLIRTRDKVIHWCAIGPIFSKCIKIRILVIFSKPTCNLLGLLENGYCQSWLLKNVCNSPESYWFIIIGHFLIPVQQ